MNFEFLYLLASQTKGKYFDPKRYAELLDNLKDLNTSFSKDKIITSEIRLWSDEWLLIVIILLFAAEWFLRKRSGML